MLGYVLGGDGDLAEMFLRLFGLGFTTGHIHGLASIYLYHYPHTLVFVMLAGAQRISASAKC